MSHSTAQAKASPSLGLLIGGISALCSRFEAVEPVEKVLDVRGKFLARDIFRRPSERRADAIRGSRCCQRELRILTCPLRDHVDGNNAIATNKSCAGEDSVRPIQMPVPAASLG